VFSGTKDSPLGVISIFDNITNDGHFHNFIFKVRNKRMCTFWNWSISKPALIIISVMHVHAISFKLIHGQPEWIHISTGLINGPYLIRTSTSLIQVTATFAYCNFCSTLERKFYIPTCSWFFTFKLIKVHDYQSRYLSTHRLSMWYQNFQLTKFPFLPFCLTLIGLITTT